MSGIQRFLTRRGERHRRVGKQEKETTSSNVRNQLRMLFLGNEPPSDLDKNDEKKLKALEKKILSVGIPELRAEQIRGALMSTYAQGDVDKAFDLLLILEDSIEGILRDYSSSTKLLGAVNRNGVTCYLDSLLFAMFARLDFFEAILYKSFTDDKDPRRKLAIILRLWVNMLRSGKLITTDITEQLQQALSECGWTEAAKLRQQDASEAFTFITEKLDLPLLTLKMDIYHTGKEDTVDDHKFINERLLEVAIPAEHTDGTAITLEECLETYFNNKIEVKRYMERRATISSVRSFDSTAKGASTHVESVEIGSSTSSPIRTSSPLPESPGAESISAPPAYTRRSSIVQERFIPDQDSQEPFVLPKQRRKGSYRKEVMMPAWQFFSLIPWYTDNAPVNDAQVAAHFSSKRPILGVCLKRYSVLPNGTAIRLNTYIDIPTEIGLPHFIQDDKMDESGPLYGNFKLLLQSVVCHRGNSVDSGHYISLVRGTGANITPPESSSSSMDFAAGSEQWMRFDDLAAERVTLVDIDQALRDESPYLLFYQIVPVDDEDGIERNLEDNRAMFTGGEGLDSNAIKHLSVISSASERTSDGIMPSSLRPSLEITIPDGVENNKQGGSAASSQETAANVDSSGLRPSTADDIDKTSYRRSVSLPRPHSKGASRSRSRGAEPGGEKGLGATFSRLAARMSKDKGTEIPAADGADSQNLTPGKPEENNEDATLSKRAETWQGDENREPETKRGGKQRQKTVLNRKERRNPERECSVM